MDAAIRIGIHILQLMGMLVAGITAWRMFYAVARHRFSTNATLLAQVRTRFVHGLLLAFEVLVAAGVLTTILHPSWSDIGKLAAIAALRMGIKKGLKYAI